MQMRSPGARGYRLQRGIVRNSWGFSVVNPHIRGGGGDVFARPLLPYLPRRSYLLVAIVRREGHAGCARYGRMLMGGCSTGAAVATPPGLARGEYYFRGCPLDM